MTTKKRNEFCFSSILGKEIIQKNNSKYQTVSTNTHLAGKIVGLYFSSSWCPPCQHFTPQLIKFYNKYHQDSNFEIVLIPYHEQSQKEFNDYFSKMSWYSLSHKDNMSITKLIKDYQCVTVPSLIFLNAKGHVIQRIVDYQERNKIILQPRLLSFIEKDSKSQKNKNSKKKKSWNFISK